MACYRSEVREYPHPRSLEALRIGRRTGEIKFPCRPLKSS